MKIGKIITLVSLATFPIAGVLSGQAPPGSPQPPPAQPSGPEADAEEILEIYGFLIGLRSGLAEFELTDEEYEIFLKGLARAQAGEAVPENVDQIIPQLQTYLSGRQAEIARRRGQANREAAAAFFANLQEKEDVESTPEGLFYRIEEEGTGERPEKDSVALIHYEGRLLDGTVFDRSDGEEPVPFPLKGVIQGMAIGLTKVKEGGKITLYIPADLAYGDQSQPPIPPGSALIFEVELVEVQEGDPGEALPGFDPQGQPPQGQPQQGQPPPPPPAPR